MDGFDALANQYGLAVAILLAIAYGAYREWWVPGPRYREVIAALRESTAAQAKMHEANAAIVASIPTLVAELQHVKAENEQLRGQRGSP